MSELITLVEVNKPGENYGELKNVLLEAGIVTSKQVLLLPKDVLCVIGHMGQARARILRNYTKCLVLPALGLQGNYKEPEVDIDPEIKPEPGHGCQETGAEFIDEIFNISESGSNDGDNKNTTSDEDDTWEV